ncbi:MAG: FHA domain-containing protein [Bdellovibrionaceae bacterium]|nr:FHA domain-containing protein [Pseudobdellovibrionaceae bacterium]
MVLFIEVLDGLRQGSRFKLIPGQIIGRREGDIVVEDQKISSRHAQIELDNKQQFVLSDLGSSNGILAGNRRVKKIALIPGVVFKLGRTSFRVVPVDDKPAAEFARIRTWRENLAETLPTDWVQNRMPESAGKTFSPPLCLKFIQGIQTDEELYLAYGPRHLGANSLDIDLKEPEAPPQVCELVPGADGFALLKNLCNNKLTINNQSVMTDSILHEGDHIRIGGTVIMVTYV